MKPLLHDDLSSFDKANDYLLFHTPEAGVVPHFVAQCLTARTLQEQGYKVVFAVCGGLLPRCPVMDMHSLAYDQEPRTQVLRKTACEGCFQAAQALLQHYGLQGVQLNSFVTDEFVAAYSRIVQNMPADLRSFEYDGIKFGLIASRDLSLAKKASEFDRVDPELYTAWQSYIAATLATYLLTGALCARLPIKRMVYFNEYCTNLGAVMAARRRGIPIVSMTMAAHCGVDRRRYTLMTEPFHATHVMLRQGWKEWRDVPLPPEDIALVAEDTMFRLPKSSCFVYSPARTGRSEDLWQQLQLAPGRRLLTAFTSSLDECRATEMTATGMGDALDWDWPRQLFVDQIDWLTKLIAYVEASEDLQLVVRIHPREGRTSREVVGVESQHLCRLREALGGAYKWCRIIWPQDPVSSYDLGEQADLVLTAFSTIGLEFARLGVPVVTSFRNLSFPSDDFLLHGGSTVPEYFESLRRVLQQPPSFDRLRRAYRCHYCFQLGTSFDFGDLIPAKDYDGVPQFTLPREAAAVESVMVQRTPSQKVRLQRLLAREFHAADAEERQEVQRQIARQLRFLMTGDAAANFTALPIHHGSAGPVPAGESLQVSGNTVIYRNTGSEISRCSPMVARLAALYEGTSAARACA